MNIDAPSGLSCVHADDGLLVLDKPPGLLCVPGRGPDKQDCLSTRAQALWPDALIVHRLDQPTSGLVLMARGLWMQRALSKTFAERRVHKRYQAIVTGHLHPGATADDNGWSAITLPIAADYRRPRAMGFYPEMRGGARTDGSGPASCAQAISCSRWSSRSPRRRSSCPTGASSCRTSCRAGRRPRRRRGPPSARPWYARPAARAGGRRRP